MYSINKSNLFSPDGQVTEVLPKYLYLSLGLKSLYVGHTDGRSGETKTFLMGRIVSSQTKI